MTHRASHKRGRTPLDDAPPFDPIEWNTSELSFIESFGRHVVEEQLCRREDLGDADGVSRAPGAAATTSTSKADATGFHTLPVFRPQSVLARLFHYFFPDWYRRHQGNLSDSALRDFSNEDLLTLMQLAMAAGERERTGVIARELSRRRLHVSVTTGKSSTGVAAGTAAGTEARGSRFLQTETGPGVAKDGDDVLLWVAGSGAPGGTSAGGRLPASTRTQRGALFGPKLARYEGSRGRTVSPTSASTWSWWPFGRGQGEARDREPSGPRAETSPAHAPPPAPQPPSFLMTRAVPPAGKTDSAPRSLADDQQVNARDTHPLDPGPVPAQYLSEAAQRPAGRVVIGPDDTTTVRGQLRPSRPVPLDSSTGSAIHGTMWDARRPPIARYAGRASTGAAPLPEFAADRSTSTSTAAWHAPQHPHNNWWEIKSGFGAAPLDAQNQGVQ